MHWRRRDLPLHAKISKFLLAHFQLTTVLVHASCWKNCRRQPMIIWRRTFGLNKICCALVDFCIRSSCIAYWIWSNSSMISGWFIGKLRSFDRIWRPRLYRLFLMSHRTDSGITFKPHVIIRKAGNSWMIRGHLHCQSEVGKARMNP